MGPEHSRQKRQELEELAKLQRKFIIVDRLARGFIVVLGLLASSVPLLIITNLTRDLAGQNTTITVSSAATLASTALASLALLQKIRLDRTAKQRLRQRVQELESDLMEESHGTTTSQDLTSQPPASAESEGGASNATPTSDPPTPGAVAAGQSWWGWGLIIGLVIAVLGNITTITTGVISRKPPPTDCLPYVDQLTKLRGLYPKEDLVKALDAINFGRYARDCGNPRRFVEPLPDAMTTTVVVPTSRP